MIKYNFYIREVDVIKKIGDGCGAKIDNEGLFNNIKKVLNYKMLWVRCGAILLVILLSVILTVAVVGAHSDGEDDLNTGNVEHNTHGEESTERVTVQNNPPSDSVITNGGIEYIDYSFKELGDYYIKNQSGSAIVYDPYAKIDKLYDSSDNRPVVLILNTQSDGKYIGDSDDITSVIELGGRLCSALNAYGVSTIHCSAIHESADMTDSYNNAEESIEFYLKMYPTIKYILDISLIRSENQATMGEFERKIASQILFEVCGNNRDTRDMNIHLAVNLRSMLNRQNMSVGREIVVSNNMLNSRYAPYYLTVYIGTQNNTSDESRLATDALGLAFAEYLSKQ